MNAITTQAPPSTGLVPRNMGEAMQLAEMMARGKMMPEHLRNAGDALMVVEQAMRWNMSPFAVGQATFSIKGKLLFAGTLVHAAIENSGAITGLIDYRFSGEGAGRKVTVIATRRGESEPKTIEVALKDAQTANDIWKKQPDQQLCYHGARVWARRWTPGVMLGVYTPEEWRDQPQDTFAGPTIEATPEPAPTMTAKPKVSEWLDALQRELDEATAADVVDEIVARPEVQRALDKLQNGARARLMEMIAGANARTAPPAAEVDDFPGGRT